MGNPHDGALQLSVTDNGKGLTNPEQPRQTGQGGHGLGNMRARAQSIGGDLSWEDAKPGTRMLLSVPLRSAPLSQAA